MSKTFKDLMGQQFCDYCGARPGERCHAKSGRPCFPHAARYYAAKWVQERGEAGP